MKAKHVHPRLKREIGFFDAVVYGVGLIIGAGIYALIGKGAGLAGNSLWLSFAIGGAVALFSGLSYAEISSAFSRDAVEYNCMRHATKNRMAAFVVGWLTVIGGVAATATVAVGFGGYFKELFGAPAVLSAIALIILCAATDFLGIRMSTKMVFLFAAVEILGLLFIMGLGAAHISRFGPVDYLDFPAGLGGVFSAAILVFFAYLGFEGIANMSEEVRNSRKTVPLAMILSIIITTVIYILIAVSAVSIADYRSLSASDAPMSLIAESAAKDFGISFPAGAIMSAIALFSTASTVMINVVVVSRILYGLRFEPAFPSAIGAIHPRTNVPHVSIFIVAGAASVLSTWGNISLLANLSTFAVFLTFLAVNVSLILLRFDASFKPRFRLPLSVKNVPVTAVIGAAWCIIMLLQFGPATITYGSLLVLAGILFFMQAKKS